MMYVMINNFRDMTPYSLVDIREILIEPFFFLCTVEHLPFNLWLDNNRGTKLHQNIRNYLQIFDTLSCAIRL
jgi:hypothetical protein